MNKENFLAVMSHYTLRGFLDTAAQFVVAAVTGYFHSIACAANSKGVDGSLQDILSPFNTMVQPWSYCRSSNGPNERIFPS